MVINEAEWDDDDLSFDGDELIYQGRSFTGTIRAHHADGLLKSESSYVAGFEHGCRREWYRNGQLRSESHLTRGRATRCREWHEDGRLKLLATYSKGINLTYDEWDDAGVHVIHREIDPDSTLGRYATGRAE